MSRLTTVRDSVPSLFAQFPAGLWHGLIGTKVLLPYYHIVSDDPVAHVKHLYRYRRVPEFTADLDWLLKRYTPITHDQLLSHRQNGTPLPKKPFHITFDDGFREIADCIAPILRAKGIPATFFVSSGFLDNQRLCHNEKASLLIEQIRTRDNPRDLREIESLLDESQIPSGSPSSRILSVQYNDRMVLDQIGKALNCDFDHYLQTAKPYLTSAQVRKLLADGFTIGAHGVDHPRFATLAPTAQIHQVQESAHFLRTTFKLKDVSFAFPHTEAGVHRSFYQTAAEASGVSLFFGTRGMVDDEIPILLQRFSMEKTSRPADWIVAKQYARRFAQILTGQSVVRRKAEASLEGLPHAA